MADFEVKKIEDLETVHGVFRRVRHDLGLTSFGVSIQDYPDPETGEMYPDHAEADQEEVYMALRGGGEVDIQGERVALESSVMVRVGPGTRHKVIPGADGLRLLAVGGIPGRPYELPDLEKNEIDGPGAPNADYTVKKIDDMEAIYRGAFYKARAELGVTSFGVQVFDLPANFESYPEHDHAESGQEEIYLVLNGSAQLDVEGETTTIDPSVIARVGATAKRHIRTSEEPARILSVGATPDKAYEITQFTELGEPDPLG